MGKQEAWKATGIILTISQAFLFATPN